MGVPLESTQVQVQNSSHVQYHHNTAVKSQKYKKDLSRDCGDSSAPVTENSPLRAGEKKYNSIGSAAKKLLLNSTEVSADQPTAATLLNIN